MKTSDSGIALIKHFEGFRRTPYLCAGGKWTVGFGHVIRSFETFSKITEEQAENILKDDLIHAENAVNALITVPLTQNQFDALASLTFNIGRENFLTSTLLKKLNAGDVTGAAAEFKKWRKSAGKVLPGLVRRRAAETALFNKTEESNA